MAFGFVPLLTVILSSAAFPVLMGADGRNHHPLGEAIGKPVAFIFISHDCPICNAYAPEIGRIQAAYGKKVDIDLVYAESRLTASQAKSHAKAFGLNRMTLLLDPNRAFAAFCHAAITPEAVVFDSKRNRVFAGRIDDRYISFGQLRPAPTSHDLTAALDAVLSHKKPKAASGPPVGCFIPQAPIS